MYSGDHSVSSLLNSSNCDYFNNDKIFIEDSHQAIRYSQPYDLLVSVCRHIIGAFNVLHFFIFNVLNMHKKPSCR